MFSVDDIRIRLADHSLVRDIDTTERGHIRIETAFLYPEGSNIDLFVVQDAPRLPSLRLSDLGQTYQGLLDLQVRPWLSKKRQAFVDDALRIYDVSLNGGALELPLASADVLMPGIVRLGQACVRVADLIYTRRSALQLPMTEEVEELIADAELAYVPGAELDGRFGNRVRVDFLVNGARTSSAVLTLSSANTTQAHVQANEIFRRWYDLNIPARTEHRVTIFDDRFDTYREEDLRRIREHSDLLPLSDRTGIRDVLAA